MRNLIVVVALVVVGLSVSARVPDGKFECAGEPLQFVPYNEHIYETSYRGVRGYLGVNARGTDDDAYAWTFGAPPEPTATSLRGSSRGTVEEAVDSLCFNLVRAYDDVQGREKFDGKAAEEALHETVGKGGLSRQ